VHRHAHAAVEVGLEQLDVFALLPMTTPGRAEWIVILALLAGRSMTMRLTAACLSLFFR